MSGYTLMGAVEVSEGARWSGMLVKGHAGAACRGCGAAGPWCCQSGVLEMWRWHEGKGAAAQRLPRRPQPRLPFSKGIRSVGAGAHCPTAKEIALELAGRWPEVFH